MAYLYNVPEKRMEGESKLLYKQRLKEVNNPVVEKLFRELAPKYAQRKEEDVYKRQGIHSNQRKRPGWV